jgi:hypothetical protein
MEFRRGGMRVWVPYSTSNILDKNRVHNVSVFGRIVKIVVEEINKKLRGRPVKFFKTTASSHVLSATGHFLRFDVMLHLRERRDEG